MPLELLTLLKFGLLLLLYLFLASTVRAVIVDLYGPRRKPPGPARPAVAPAAGSTDGRKPRRVPRELVLHHPSGRPQVVPLRADSLTFGRARDADVPLDDVYVSDEHARIELDGDGWVVRDLGSTNGTFLNSAKVARPTPITAGDQLRLGKTRIEVRR
jgi:pSer/pThr/pTyr-binding forkhead associated (FHA) protein